MRKISVLYFKASGVSFANSWLTFVKKTVKFMSYARGISDFSSISFKHILKVSSKVLRGV